VCNSNGILESARRCSLRDDSESGFSILELLIAMTILGVIVAQMTVAMINQGATQRTQQRGLDTLDTTRLALDLIVSDTRNAGFMVPRWAGVAAVDGGAGAADRLCVSDSGYFDLPAPGSGAETALDLKTDRFAGAEVLGFLSDRDIRVKMLDVDEYDSSTDFANSADFVAGGGVIIAQSDGAPNPAFPARGLKVFCARIETGGVIDSMDDAPDQIRLIASHAIPGGLFGASNVVAIPAIIYEVNGGLMRNGQTLSTAIEDLQVELWVDVSGTPDGIEQRPAEFPIHDINAMDPMSVDSSRVRRVQVTLVGRSALRELRPGANLFRPAVANRSEGKTAAELGFTRKVMQAGVLPRNLLEPNVYGLVP